MKKAAIKDPHLIGKELVANNCINVMAARVECNYRKNKLCVQLLHARRVAC